VAFVPLAIYKSLDWAGLPLLFGAAALYAAAGYALFKAGLRRYESGNRMGARM
jgi:ABC-2 type transport system permease protein